jgi:RNA polymerase sigma factor (TIGR02999 family)
MRNAVSNRVARHPSDDPERKQALCLLVESVYPEMCRVAANYLRAESPSESLQPAGLVHEAFLRLAESASINPADRVHVIALLCRQMRRILIEHGRHRAAEHHQILLHGPFPKFSEIHDVTVAVLLNRLAAVDERAAHVIELRVWGGFTNAEIAEVLKVSTSTVRRDWEFGCSWLAANMTTNRSLAHHS